MYDLVTDVGGARICLGISGLPFPVARIHQRSIPTRMNLLDTIGKKPRDYTDFHKISVLILCNLVDSQSDDVDASNNFWGAGMNNSTIDASVHDDEEGACEVTFYPFETDPYICAPAPTPAGPPAFTTADAVIALEIAVGSRPPDLH